MFFDKKRFLGYTEDNGECTFYIFWIPVYRSYLKVSYKLNDCINKIFFLKKELMGVPVYYEKIEDYVRTRNILGISCNEVLEMNRITDLLKLQELRHDKDSCKLKEQFEYLTNRVSGLEISLLNTIEEFKKKFFALSESSSEKEDQFYNEFHNFKEDSAKNIVNLSQSIADFKLERDKVNKKYSADLEVFKKKSDSFLSQVKSDLDNVKDLVISSKESGFKDIIGLFEDEVKKISDRIDEINVESLNKSNDMIVNVIAKRVNDSVGVARENEWAAIFNNTIYNSSWLNDRSFSPGRWAVGYQFLYVMYRILNEVKPKSILELGLGQSTRMIAQYVRASSDVNHYVVEHDPGWIEFFSNNFAVPESTTIVQLPWDFRPYKEAERVRCYKDFAANFKDKVFDFISIDGPLGGDMHQYARIDTLSIVPESLAENFVIMIDDTERSGEIGMIAELLAKLDAAGIKYKVGRYRGEKQATVICSLAWGFLSSM